MGAWGQQAPDWPVLTFIKGLRQMMTTLTLYLTTLLTWVQTTDGTNITMALICAVALCGVPARLVLFATLCVHLALLYI
jgi:hypothetical protein